MQKNQKIVLITGASTGMGRTTAEYLSGRGYLVYAGSREPDRLEDISSSYLRPIKLDITSPESIKETMTEIGVVDILINNAGYGLVATVEEATETQMLEQFDVNVFGVLRMCKAVIPAMRGRKEGTIINISSFLGRIGLPLLTFYNASKYAVEGITDSLRYELRPFGIRVHSVMPGFFDTEFARSNLRINEDTTGEESPYKDTVDVLAPAIIDQINHGNNPAEVAELIEQIINDEHYLAHQTAGDKARKFIPMKKELSYEDFERRVREYYGLT